jgi:hypothetical protein
MHVTRLFRTFSLPLLAKELIEQAARKRTYVVRVVYAVLLFFAALMFFQDTLRVGSASPLAVLGRGRDMFAVLVALQFAGVYFFMPAMTCSVVTQEKERNSLQLLFLTRLGPWTILFEKLMSRLIPMFGFVMLSLPLLAFAYTLGGISPEYLASGIWLLALAVIQMATLALACSAFFRTTVGAFIWSYILGLFMFFGPALGWLIIYSLTGFQIEHFARAWFPTFNSEAMFLLPFFGPAFFEPHGNGGIGLAPLIIHSVLVVGASVTFLFLARAFIVRRAFALPGNVVLGVFKGLDNIFLRLNNNPITRGKTFVGDTAALPDSDPVAWRETAKRSLGKARYLLRVFIAIELPVAAICVMVIFDSHNAAPLSMLLFPVGAVSVLMVSVQAASLIAGERSHQTLDVLCTTPLLGRDIIRQKFQSVRRLMLVLLVPFLTIFLFECGMKWRMPGPYPMRNGLIEFDLALYLACSLLSVGIYLPMFAWLSLYIGLRVKTQTRAIMGSLAAILAWCIGPPFAVLLLATVFDQMRRPDSGLIALFLFSPAFIMGFNESNDWAVLAKAPWIAVIVNFTAYGLILVCLRKLCYAHANRLLGRADVDELAEIGPKSAKIPENSEIEACLIEK